MTNTGRGEKNPSNVHHYDSVVIRSQHCITNTRHCNDDDAATQNYNDGPTLLQHWIVSSTRGVLRILYWQRHGNVDTTLSNSQRPHNVHTKMLNSQHYANVAYFLVSKFNSQYIMDVVISTSIPRWNYDAKFTTLRRCNNVASALQRMSNVNYSWSQGNISMNLAESLLTTWHLSGMHGQYWDIKFKQLFPFHTLKIPNVFYERFLYHER